MVVNLGGFGSVTGAFWAGILVGVIEVMGGLLLGPQFKLAVVLVLFLAVLMFWLFTISASISLFAPRNSTLLALHVLCSASVAGAPPTGRMCTAR